VHVQNHGGHCGTYSGDHPRWVTQRHGCSVRRKESGGGRKTREASQNKSGAFGDGKKAGPRERKNDQPGAEITKIKHEQLPYMGAIS